MTARDYARRRKAVLGDRWGVLITNVTNVRWLTGFTGSNGSVALLPDRVVLVTDGRYRERAADELRAAGVDAEVVTGFTQAEQQERLVEQFAGISTVGAEAASLSHARWSALAARTFVPDTAASRAAGAGAGLTDND